MSGYWEELERPGPDSITVDGIELRPGSRVRLAPRAGADVLDLALAGRLAVIEGIEQDLDGRVALAVVLDDDPGRDLGLARQPGHRFFFSPGEVEAVAGDSPVAGDFPGADDFRGADSTAPSILVAGIGNVFLGDDGFGVALADRLARLELPAGVKVVDFGIRGMDLAFAMQDGYDAVVLLDATPRGEPPGTLYVIEADRQQGVEVSVDAHGLDPVQVMGLVRALGGVPPRTFVVGCEPQTRLTLDDEEIVAQLSEPVRAALPEAVRLTQSLIDELASNPTKEEVSSR
jgi:hydrogenase maturation protease